MPPPNTVILTVAAQKDLRDIEAYTLQQWGERQATRYISLIEEAIDTVGDNPKLGRVRPSLSADYRVYAVKSHFLVYKEDAQSITVLRILHQRMNIFEHVEG
jgi:toxin ParE1/3/4